MHRPRPDRAALPSARVTANWTHSPSGTTSPCGSMRRSSSTRDAKFSASSEMSLKGVGTLIA
ncbi:MAG TPA: hypothetical protein DEF51_56865 [Myxococcales bacterium]|nr:hypothetical protein [Myxococcales bacterium]